MLDLVLEAAIIQMQDSTGGDTPIRAAQRPKGLRFRFFRSFAALTLREMTTTYGRSPGGYAWAVLEPVAGIAVLSIVFSFVMRAPSLGTNFIYFFSGGVLLFTLYGSASNAAASSVRFSQALLEYPAVSFIDALLARFVLNAMTQLLVMFIVIAGIILIYDLQPILRWPALFQAIAMTLALSFGLGTVNCYLTTSYPLWERIWAVLNRPMFFISGVMFVPEDLPWKVRDYLMWNPLMHATSEMRKGMFVTYDAVHVSPLYVFTLSLGLTMLGLLLLRRHHKDLVLK